jgi:ubiquinone/menaquinone biosynthesis C-methylase UbiE
MSSYLHGYDPAEQRRLIDQAEFWSERLILPALDYKPGERLLDVGCGVGAVLAVIARRFPGLELAGIDIEPRQIEAARAYLASLGLSADLRAGDAANMPWESGAAGGEGGFDHAYMMWFIEHLRDAAAVLREVRRVLKPGGTVTIHETDYGMFQIWPASRDWDALEQAQRDHFQRHGNAAVGRRLGTLLHQAGFSHVKNVPVPFHHFSAGATAELRAFTTYIAGFLEPAIPEFVRLGADEGALRRGLEHLRGLPEMEEGTITVVLFRAAARAPGG